MATHKGIVPNSIGATLGVNDDTIVISLGILDGGPPVITPIKLVIIPLHSSAYSPINTKSLDKAINLEVTDHLGDVICHELFVNADGNFNMLLMLKQ